MTNASCPCDDRRGYAQCCEPLHCGEPAATAEALMRSRYSAYARKLEAYLLTTWHPSTRPQSLDLSKELAKWIGLKIVRHESHGDAGMVEFVARFRVGGGSVQRFHEVSRFVHEHGSWFYVDGIHNHPAQSIEA